MKLRQVEIAAPELIDPKSGQGGDMRATQHGTSPMPPIADRAEATSVIRQVMAHSPRVSDGRIEITLSPEELGRVRMAISGIDGAMTVTIQADRSETLDLMRRHQDQLMQEFLDAGYGDVSFDFGQSADRQREHRQAEMARNNSPGANPASDIASLGQQPTNSTGLDLRL
ncbi:flagellar hook-length control protein FliK [Salinihabitans flavidus]|nr:flagellar hook-length control protein FliK [Salinihabitans flavidus]